MFARELLYHFLQPRLGQAQRGGCATGNVFSRLWQRLLPREVVRLGMTRYLPIYNAHAPALQHLPAT
jgi:hypothetical protein